MKKIKTFMFQDGEMVFYNGNDNWIRTTGYGTSRKSYNFKTDYIDNIINDWIDNNQINVVSIQQSSFVKGNNPPTSILVYTIVYDWE